MKPTRGILHASFVYTSSVNTSIAKTFARERKRLADAVKIAESAQRAADAELEQRASDTAAVHATFNRRRIKAVK